MTKDELAAKLAQQSQLSAEEAGKFIDAFVQTLSQYFRRGEKVVIAEFGSFYIRDDQSIQFNPSAKLKELVE